MVAGEPFLKWAGGKTQLLSQLARLYPSKIERYFEPFVGSGAVFFDIQKRFRPRYVMLSDTNSELINCYEVVRDEIEELIQNLLRHREGHHAQQPEYYYGIRDLSTDTLSPVERAARFIYLNKTCYNGLYRVNARGQFNVPIGRYKNPAIANAEGLHAASRVLRGVRLAVQDFAECLPKLRAGDVVYIDPPYFPLSRTANFSGYPQGWFGLAGQERLARFAQDAGNKGCLVMLSNSDTAAVRKLYRGLRTRRVRARRAINSNGAARGAITELVITNYKRSQGTVR